MKIYSVISELRAELKKYRRKDCSIGFVPTMGFLHEGHLSLVRKSCKENLITVVSIFVNPTQFGPNEDLDRYPRDIQRDETMLQEENVDYLFYPGVDEIYPKGFSTKVSVSGLTEGLCGASRVGHFDGVALIVTKLLNIVQPTKVYFGLKDFQQFKVVSRMVKDLNMDTIVTGLPIMREGDGLAMSSRNVFLKNGERDSALSMYHSFNIIKKQLELGERSTKKILKITCDFLKSHTGVTIDYAEIVDPETLQPLSNIQGDFVYAVAIYIGNTRLLDNKLFSIS